MYLKNINKFLEIDFDYNKTEFLKILKFSNKNDFNIYKLEKDFLLTVILTFLGKNYPELIFKGGTCLNKIYLDYFRLSEDLDFVLINNEGRSTRKRLIKNYKERLEKDLGIIGLKIVEGRISHNNDSQGIFHFGYRSLVDNSEQVVQVDISLKEKLELKPREENIKSVFEDIYTEEEILGFGKINSMDFDEIVAEKIRAALTRITPAIRDFFDIFYISKNTDFDFSKIKNLLKIKLEEADFKYTLDGKLELLDDQIKTDLLPMLDNKTDFNLKEIYDFIQGFKVK